MQKALQDFVTSLGYTFEISLQKQPGAWHYVAVEGFKGAYIFKEIKFADALSIWLTVYDYKKAEAFTFRHDTRTLTDEELAKVDKIRQELDKKYAEQKAKVNQDCREYCTKEWSKYEFTVTNSYFDKKGVTAPKDIFKSRTSEVDGQAELLCPMVDAENNFWGYQVISERRGKDFNIGQRTESVFVPCGSFASPSRIYITEGVATMLSVFEGAGCLHPVVAALSANNIPKVAKALRKQYPKTPFIIMADNDQWAQSGNAGVKFAELAESETDGIVVAFPDFAKEHPDKPTDWNDFHKLNGIDKLKHIIDATKPVRPEHFWALGHAKGMYYFTNLRAPEIHATKDFSTTDLYKIVTLKKWKSLYPEFVHANGKLDFDAIKSELVDLAQKKGHFRADESRGIGIYLNQGQSLVHLGDRVLFDAREQELQDFEGEQFYDLKFRRNLPPRPPESHDQKDFVRDLRAVLGGYTWENKLSPELIIGWLYCAYASGALSWRPHLLVSAKAGSGKSTIASLIVEVLLAYSGYVKKEDVTEAGLRQELENNSVPVVHDEFDTNRGEAKRLASVLNLLRAASSGGSISRGTPSGKSLKFEARFCAYLTGINPPNLNEADQTRITTLRLLKQNPRPWNEVKPEVLRLATSESARGIFWQVVDTLPAFMKSAETIQTAFAQHGERVGQQYGALLAGFWQMFHVEQITKAEAERFVKNVELASDDVGEKLMQDDNAERCLTHLLSLSVRVSDDKNSHELSIAQILEADSGSQDLYGRELGRIGVKRVSDTEIFVAGHQHILDAHYEKTQWQNYSEALVRLPGSVKTRLRVGGQSVRGVRVTLPSI